jgi:hypothetical protein
MVPQDTSQFIEVVRDSRAESVAYFRQWALWLGVGSAGGAIAMISLAANLPDPDFAFQLFVPSLWAFLVGVICAAASQPVAALRAEATGHHFAEAHNREQTRNAAYKLPELIASVQRVADEMNVARDELVRRTNSHHAEAERAWAWRSRWHALLVGLLAISVVAFLVGVASPLVYVSRGGKLVGPAGAANHHTTARGSRSISAVQSKPNGH